MLVLRALNARHLNTRQSRVAMSPCLITFSCNNLRALFISAPAIVGVILRSPASPTAQISPAPQKGVAKRLTMREGLTQPAKVVRRFHGVAFGRPFGVLRFHDGKARRRLDTEATLERRYRGCRSRRLRCDCDIFRRNCRRSGHQGAQVHPAAEITGRLVFARRASRAITRPTRLACSPRQKYCRASEMSDHGCSFSGRSSICPSRFLR